MQKRPKKRKKKWNSFETNFTSDVAPQVGFEPLLVYKKGNIYFLRFNSSQLVHLGHYFRSQLYKMCRAFFACFHDFGQKN